MSFCFAHHLRIFPITGALFRVFHAGGVVRNRVFLMIKKLGLAQAAPLLEGENIERVLAITDQYRRALA